MAVTILPFRIDATWNYRSLLSFMLCYVAHNKRLKAHLRLGVAWVLCMIVWRGRY